MFRSLLHAIKFLSHRLLTSSNRNRGNVSVNRKHHFCPFICRPYVSFCSFERVESDNSISLCSVSHCNYSIMMNAPTEEAGDFLPMECSMRAFSGRIDTASARGG
jgi:hypothetical protein